MSETMIRGAKGGSKQHTPVESPDNLRSIAYFRILDLVSEGEIAGLVNGQQSIYLDETPLVNSDGTSNFPKAHVEARTGTQDQDVIPGFDSVENEISVGVELKSTAAWVQSITDTSLSAVRVTIGVPALSKADTSNGDIKGYAVAYKIEVSTDGGAYAEFYNGSFRGKTTSKYQRSHRIDLPAATTGWQIRVTRLTDNANSSSVADITTIDSYTEIVDAKLRYPNSALVALMGDASQFSNIPNRAYDLFGRIIQVPSNYDVAARTYSGTWDGTFKPSWTDNPAWIFYDLVTHPRYGLGHLVDKALVDKWELYKIGQYCDGMVDDGMGGQEPRLTCNIFLQAQADAYKLLNDLSTAFRGISYWANGTIVASADMPSDPVFTYTDANVIGGQFSYSASGRKTRYTTALVSWNDPRNFYRTKVEYVEDRDGIARYGVQQTAVTAVGCVSQGQAQRFGRWILLTSRLETDTITFRVGLDGVLAAPGQIIRVADSARAGKRQGGRIVSATTTTVTLDKAPTVAAGDTITVGMPDGVSQTRTVLSVAGAVVTVSTAFTATPVAQAAWTVESGSLEAQTFRVLAVTEDKSDTEISFTITALQHNASKFDAVDFGTLIQVPPISALTITNQAGPAAVSLESAEVVDPAATTKLLTIAWTAVPGAVAYEAEWRKDDGEWRSLGILTGLSADIRGAGAGDYVARVRAKGTGRAYSLYTYSNTYTLGAATTLPTSVADIQTEASQAAADAAAANAELANIASDNMLTPGEKPTVIRDYNVITTEQAGIDAQATAYGITTEKTAYDGKVTALTTYLGTLTSPTDWDDISGNTTIVGATFRQKFADVYTARQALLNAIYAAAKAKADAAQQTADEAHSLASQVAVLNPGFDAGDTGWTKEGGWSIKSDGSFGVGSGYAQHDGSTTNQTKALRNNAICFVQPGKSYKVQALIKAIGANGQCFARISWRDISDTEIGTTVGNAITGTIVNGSYAVGQAPTGAVYAHAEVATSAHTAGVYQVDNVTSTLQPATADEISESATKKWAGETGATVGATWGSNVFGQPQAVGANLVWHGDFTDNSLGAWASNDGGSIALNYPGLSFGVGVQTKARDTYEMGNWIPCKQDEVLFMRARMASGSVDLKLGMNFVDKDGNSTWVVAATRLAGNSWGVVQGSITVPTGAVKGRPWIGQNITAGSESSTGYFAQVDLQRTALMQSGSGARLGGLRNQVMVGVGNFASAWNGGAITYSATSTSATITAGAATLVAGDDSVAYNQASTTVSGSAGATTKYYLYYDDGDYTGGSQTLHATTSVITSLNANGRVKVGEVTVTFPTSGTGSGTGGNNCPDENAWVLRADPNGIRPDWPVRAKAVRMGHFLRLTDGTAGLVTYSERKAAERVRVIARTGDSLTCSTSAPLELADGECVPAPECAGHWIRALAEGGPHAAFIERIEPAGPGHVQHITCQNACFWTGDDPDYLFGHHNMKPA